MARYTWHDIPVEITRKKIGSLRLRVHLPTGRVRISAPHAMSIEAIRDFVVSRKDWIARHRVRSDAFRAASPGYEDGATHYFLGKRLALETEGRRAPGVRLADDRLCVRVRGEVTDAKTKRVLYAWYRDRLYELADSLLEKWETALGVEVRELCVRAMRSKWGSCKPGAARVCLNLELAKRRKELVEFVLVHELVHFVERGHNARFKRILTQCIPDWKKLRRELNTMAPG